MTNGTPANYIQFFIVIMIEGFCMGGAYNILKFNQNLVADFKSREKDMFGTLIYACIYLSSGIVALVIGAVMSFGESAYSHHTHGGIFEVMKVVAIMALLFLGLWMMHVYDKL